MIENDVVLKERHAYTVTLTEVNFNHDCELIIWAQAGEDADEALENIAEKLQDAVPERQQLSKIEPGIFCMCQYIEDQEWYRACIESQTASGKWEAHFIDYGNFEIFDENSLYQLPPQLCQPPAVAKKFVFDGSIQPVQTAGLWTFAVVESIVNAFMYNKIDVKVTKVCSGQFEIHSSAISSLLVQKGLASVETAYLRSSFPVGEKFQAYVSNASKDGTLFLQELESSKSLDELMNSLSEYYSMPDNLVHVPLEKLIIGNLVAAVYSQDHGYYRAQITSIVDDLCTVRYIDYGNSEQQEKVSLFVLPKEFCNLNYQAVPCELHDLHIPEEHYSKQLQSVLLDKLYEQLVDIEIMGHGTKLSISGSYQGDRLGSSLVVDGFAKLKHEQNNQSFEYMEIEEGSLDDVLISHVESNGIFYVTKLNEACEIDKLTSELGDYCSTAKPLTKIANEVPCCALFDQDDSWYRAIVKSCDQNQALVYYVDFGNTASCETASLRCISENLLGLNCQAIKCSILRPLHSDEIKLLGNLVGEVVKVKFLKKNASNSYVVKVVHDGKTLFLSSAGNTTVSKSSQELQSKEKVMLQPKIKLGTTNLVQITHVESINKIWGRLKSSDEQFKQMCEKLDTLCNVFSEDLSNSVQALVMLGSLCAISDLNNGKWFRAEVRSMPAKLTYSVFLVDIGESRNVSVDAIKKITDQDLIDYPAQALPLSLQDSIDAVDDEQFAKLCSFLQDNTFSAKFVNCNEAGNSYEVELVDTNGKLINGVFDKANENRFPVSKSINRSSAVNETFELVAVCFVEDPDCMWIQQLTSDRQLFQLLKDMISFYSNLPSNVLCFHDPQFDSLCSVKIKEEQKENWYRGRVLCLYGDVVEVKLIDFGNEVRTTLKNVKLLSPQFQNIAPHAFRCKLFNVKPTSEQWTAAAIHRLFQLTKEAKTIKARFVEKQSLCHIVDLLVNIDGKEIRVSDNLVELNHAVWVDQPVTSGEISPVPSSSHTSNIDRLSVSSGRSSRSGLHRLFYHSPGVALVGAEIKVVATEVESPDDFFITIDDPSYYNRYTQLAKDVNAACSTFYPDIREEELYVGMPCCVFYDRTKQWCRGAVLYFQDLEKVQICLVDYGCVVECKLSSVQSISSQFVTEAPPAAMRCTLRGIVEPKGISWSLDAKVLTQNFFRVNQKNLTCTMHGCASDDIGTYFMCSVRASRDSLVDELVNAGVGVKSERMGQLFPPLKLKSFVFSNLDFVEGKDLKFYVSHVVDLNLFYCQLASQIPVVNSMLHELQQHCIRGNHSVVTPEMLAQDCVCFAKLEGKQWNRAHFVSSAPNGIVKVMFVDHGNTEEVHLRDVQKFSNDKFFLLPIQALPCCLKDVNAPSSDTKRREIISRKMQKLLSKRILSGVVTGSTNGKFHLKLFCDGKSINDLVTNDVPNPSQLSSRNKPVSVPAHPPPNSNLAAANLQTSIVSLPERDLTEGTTFNTDATTSEIVINSANVWQGERPVFISHVVSSDKIFLQDVDILSKLEELMFEVNDDVKFETLVRPEVNLFCFARYDVDGQLYRAVIEKVISEPQKPDRFLVKFVDYGNTSTVCSSDLKTLSANFAVLPQVALPCVLSFLPETLTSDEILVKLKHLSASENERLLASLELYQQSGHYSADVKVESKGKGSVSLYMYLLGNSVSPEKESTNVISADEPKYTAIDYILNQKDCEVYVSHVENPGHFYCQLSDSCDDLDNMMNEIEVYYNVERAEDLVQSLHVLSVGFPCIAKYQQDGKWYRASVERLDCDGKITVRFVDYGNAETLSISEVRKISIDFCVLPIQAIHCYAAHVNSDASAWTFNEVDAFDERVAEHKLRARFSKVVDEKDNIFEVTLKLPDGSLLNNDYLKCLPSDSIEAEKCESSTDVYKHSDTAPVQAASPSVCHFSADDIFLTGPHIEEGAVKDCYVSFAKTSTNFYVQLAESESDIDSLYALAAEDAQANQSDRFDASVGKYCVAKSPSDGEWYRGKITEAGEKATVCFVDYGDSAIVEWKEVKPMTKQTADLPIQGISCYLANISDFSEGSINSVAEAFLNTVMDKKLIIKFLTRSPDMKWEVNVTVDGLDVAEKLRGCVSTPPCNIEKQTTQVASFDAAVPAKLNEPPVHSANIQNHSSDNEKKTIEPGIILRGEIVYVTSLSSFYVKVSNALSSSLLRQSTIVGNKDKESDEMRIFLAKRFESDNWQDAVMVRSKNGDDIVLFIDDFSPVKREEVYEIGNTENSTSGSSRILHCRLPDLKCSESVSKMQYFNNRLLRKDVFITFLEFHPSSLSWIVDLALVSNDIDAALQDDVQQDEDDYKCVSQDQGSEDVSQHSVATSVQPLSDACTATSDPKSDRTSDLTENSKAVVHLTVKPQLKYKCTVKDCLTYFTFVCNEVKSLLHGSTPSEDVIKIIDDALLDIKSYSKPDLRAYAGGDGGSFCQTFDDHKRSSSAMLSVVGPPKKPRLGNFEAGAKDQVKNKVIHLQDIRPHNPSDDEQYIGENETAQEEKQPIELETVVDERHMEQLRPSAIAVAIEDKDNESNQADNETTENKELNPECLISVADEILNMVFQEAWQEVPSETMKEDPNGCFSSSGPKEISDSGHVYVSCDSADMLDSCKDRPLSCVPISESQTEFPRKVESQKTFLTENVGESSRPDVEFVAGYDSMLDVPPERILQDDVTSSGSGSTLANENLINNECPFVEDDTANKRNDIKQQGTYVGNETDVLSKDGDEAEVLSKDGDETEVLSKDGDETEVLSKDGDETEVLSKDVDETKVLSKDVDETEVLPNDGDETEVLPNDGDETEVLPNDGDETEVLPNDGDETEVLPNDGDETEVLPNDGDETEVLSNDGDETEVLSNDGDETEVLSNDGDETKVLPNDGDETEVLPNDGDETKVLPNDGDETKVLPNDGDETEVLQNDGDETEVLSNDGDETKVLPNDGDETKVLPNDGDETKVLSNDGNETEVLPNDGDETEVLPNDGDETEVLPNDGDETENLSNDDEYVRQDVPTEDEDGCVVHDIAPDIGDRCFGQEIAAEVDGRCAVQDVAGDVDDLRVRKDVAIEVVNETIDGLGEGFDDNQMTDVTPDELQPDDTAMPANGVKISINGSATDEVVKINETDVADDQIKDLVKLEAINETGALENSPDQTEVSLNKCAVVSCVDDQQLVGNTTECLNESSQDFQNLSDSVEIEPKNEESIQEEEICAENMTQTMSSKNDGNTVVGLDFPHNDATESFSAEESEPTNLQAYLQPKGDGYATASDEMINDDLSSSVFSTPVPEQPARDDNPKPMFLADTSAMSTSLYSTPIGSSRGDAETISLVASSQIDALRDSNKESSSHRELFANVSHEDTNCSEGVDS